MKKNILLSVCILFLASSFIFAQESNEVKEYKLSNGVPLYYVKNTTNQIDSVLINVQDGINYITPEYSGLQSATLSMMLQGSKKYDFDYLQNFNYETSTSFNEYADNLNSGLSVTSTEPNLEASLSILTDCFLNPVFSEKEYQKLIVNYKNAIQSLLNDPLNLTAYYAKKLLAKGTAMESATSVTPDSLKNITLSEIKKYHENFIDSRKLSVIAVTGMEAEELIKILNQTIGSIQAKKTVIVNKKLEKYNFDEKPLVLTHEYAAGSGYILRFFPDISIQDPDYYTTEVVGLIYSNILYNVVRAKWGICYSVSKSDMGGFVNAGYEMIYQCSDLTKIKEALNEARKIMNEGNYVSSTDSNGNLVLKPYSVCLENFKNSLITSTFSSQKTTYGLASRILVSLELYGDTTTINKNVDKILQIQAADVDRVFKETVMSTDELWVGTVGPDDEELLEEVLNK